MKNLSLLFFLFSALVLSAQPISIGPPMVNLSDAVDDSLVAENCYGLNIEVLSFSATIPLSDIEIFMEGVDTLYAYKTSKQGKTFVITEKENISLIFKSKSSSYFGGTVSNIQLEKGKSKYLQVYLGQKLPFNTNDKPPVVRKPVIYFYSEKEMDLDIVLKPKADLIFSYPEYKNGWSAKLLTDGNISVEGKIYPYLFWEGNLWNKKSVSDFKSGFTVSKDQTVAFLEEKLAFMGLNQREMTDFITFWAPQMMEHDQVFVHFVCAQDYADQIAELELSVKPDSEIRINMFFAPVNKDFQTTEQPLQQFSRKGFTVVEWGGAELNEMP
jgi:hypothetical protein